MLYSGKEVANPQGHAPAVNNNTGPIVLSKGQKFTYCLVCIFTLGIYVICKKNSLNALQIKINESASGIDIQLQNRFDTLNKLVQAVSSQVKFDKETLENIAALRSGGTKGNINDKAKAVAKVDAGIAMAFEAYPTLGADDSIRKMMTESTMIEREIAASRRLYNSYVTSFNTQIYSIPASGVASKLGYEGIPLFEASEASKKDVKLEF